MIKLYHQKLFLPKFIPLELSTVEPVVQELNALNINIRFFSNISKGNWDLT